MSDGLRELVFVYGTLRRGGSNAFRMKDAEFVGAATVRGVLYSISWYPGLVIDGSAGAVTGDLYLVDPELLRELDAFEGISANEIEGAEYRRVRVPATADGRRIEAWAYEWIGPVDPARKVGSGDWLAP
jgi:gamma-glutamylcyclotransferase (GGCT)/AIG2-like uncharacterized protein YtfP